MASADGRIVIDIELEDGSVVRGLGDIGDQADRVGSRTSSAFGKVGSALKTVGTIAVGAVVGVAALGAAAVGLSAPLVKAAADAEALNSQFSQVFAGIEQAAENSLAAIGQATSINTGRLRGSFVQIAAFARTTGVDTQGALELSSRALTAAADSAAFYDRSIEDTTESLQSFLKGNFENDAALGISATETTRNAVANRLYGQSFKELDEAQKQLALLTLVEDGNKLGGALGQAARESDGLENVLGNLRQAYEDFKISLGGAILETAIDLLKGLTSVINNIDTAPLVAGLSIAVDALRSLFNFIRPFLSSFVSSFQSALSTVSGFWSSEGGNILKTARTIFTTVYTTVTGLINQITPVVQTVLTTIRGFWERDGATIFATAQRIFTQIFDIISNILSRVIAIATIIIADITRIWDQYGQQILAVVTFIFTAVLAVFNFVLPAIQFIVEVVWGTIVDIIEGALGIINGVVNIFAGLFTGDISRLWDGVKELFSSAIQFILGLVSLSFIGAIRTALTNFVKATVQLIKGQWDDITRLFTSSVNGISTTISGWVTNILNFFRNLGTNAYNLAVGIWNGVVNAFTAGISNAIRFVSGLKDDVLRIVGEINLFDIGKNIIQGLINGIGSLAGKIGDKVKEITNLIPEGIRSFLNINSPSRVTTELGEFTGQGLEVGLDNSIRGIKKATNNVAKAAIPNNVVNRLAGSSVGFGGVSASALTSSTPTSNVSSVNNSTNPVYNINVQNDQSQELERTFRRLQFAY